jgi:glycosyltransferase involved in cell wall biosynthesis
LAAYSRPQSRHDPARVVFLLEELNFGGTQRQTLELARRLDPRKYRPEIWLLRSGQDLAPLARAWQLPLVWLAQSSLVGPLSLLNLWRRLRQDKIDLFLTLTAIPNIWGRLLGKLAGLPCIIGNVRSNTAHRQHERWLWPLAQQVVCNNQRLERLLVKTYKLPPSRLTMIPNGVDTDFFQPPAQNLTDGSLTVLSIGRLVPDKDQETLLRAFRLVLQDHPAAQLWLVGDGPRQNQLAELMQQTLPARQARLIAPQADIRPFLQQASLFALSSVTEALPNVVLEAMAAGLPVVATNVGGLPEAVLPEQTGRLVPPGDPVALAQAMAHLLADAPLRRRFGQAGRERAVREFSFQQLVCRYEALFDACLGGPGGSS